jgi:hypothetical protein
MVHVAVNKFVVANSRWTSPTLLGLPSFGQLAECCIKELEVKLSSSMNMPVRSHFAISVVFMVYTLYRSHFTSIEQLILISPEQYNLVEPYDKWH